MLSLLAVALVTQLARARTVCEPLLADQTLAIDTASHVREDAAARALRLAERPVARVVADIAGCTSRPEGWSADVDVRLEYLDGSATRFGFAAVWPGHEPLELALVTSDSGKFKSDDSVLAAQFARRSFAKAHPEREITNVVTSPVGRGFRVILFYRRADQRIDGQEEMNVPAHALSCGA